MGSFVVYIIEWALCLSAFLLLYKMCFSGSTFHRFNRIYLLGSVMVAALLPLIHIVVSEQMEPVAEVCRLDTTQFEPLSIVTTLPTQTLTDNDLPAQLSTSQKIFIVIAIIYLFYITIQIIGWIKSMVKMILFLRGKRIKKVNRWIRLVVHDEEYGPFNWMNYIVISDKESGFGRRASMRHELSHIKLLHPIDLVFILLCTLVNPVCWLVMKEIKVVHEYEADDEVINHYYIQSRDYQRLLVLRTVGAEAYALASSFNLNIKTRIIMMKKKQTNWWRMMWIAVTIPLVGIALTAFSKPKEALKEIVDSSVEIIEQPIVNALSTEAEATEAEEIDTSAEELVQEEPDNKPVKRGDKITGIVKDDIGPLMFANIVEIDENGRIVAKATSEADGSFTLKVVNPKDKIRISYVGKKTQTLDITNKKIVVTMEDAMKFNPVQLLGNRDSIDRGEKRYTDYNLEDGDETTFQVVESIPTFPGGIDEIMKYLMTHLRYPTVAREINAEAEITVQFIIDKTGFVRSPKAIAVTTHMPEGSASITGADENDDEEAIEKTKAYTDAIEALKEEAVYVVRNMPRWNPGRQNGKRIETTYTLPISFKLN